MRQEIRDRVIGCSSQGREHIENVKSLDRVELTALADPHQSSAALHLVGRCATVPSR